MKYTKREKELRERFFINDNILDEITANEILITLNCNEKIKDKSSLNKVFKEILDAKIQNALELFDLFADLILKEAK